MNRSKRPIRLWTEDDATMHQGASLGHETLAAGFQRLFGRPLEDAKKTAIAQFDHGDAYGWVLQDGTILSHVCDGDTIERDELIAWLHDRIAGPLSDEARNECIVLRQRLAEEYQ